MTDPFAPAPRGVLDTKRVIEILGLVVAPVTALTALLGYVGWIRSKAFFSYFGIDQGLLNLSIQDYVLRSADVTFGAVARLLAALVVLALGDRLLAQVQQPTDLGGSPQQTGTARGRRLPQVLAVTGLTLSLAGLLLALGLGKNWGLPALLGPAVLGVGSVVTFRFRRALGASPTESRSLWQISVAALVAALSLALFWAATLYAQNLGQRAAVAADTGSTTFPSGDGIQRDVSGPARIAGQGNGDPSSRRHGVLPVHWPVAAHLRQRPMATHQWEPLGELPLIGRRVARFRCDSGRGSRARLRSARDYGAC